MPTSAGRADEVDDRSEPGHWEIDQIIGARNQSSLLTFTERQTRWAIAITMPEGYDAQATLAGLIVGLERIPGHLLCSITFDQGSEWAEWEAIAATYDMDVWFCDPHSTSITSPPSSAANADATSTTTAMQRSTLQPPCTDHWNRPSPSRYPASLCSEAISGRAAIGRNSPSGEDLVRIWSGRTRRPTAASAPPVQPFPLNSPSLRGCA